MQPQFIEISPERRAELIEYVARRVVRMGLSSAAVFAIEMNRPLAFVYSSLVHMASPVAGAVFNPRMLAEIAQLLEDRSNFDRLISRIEELEAQEQQQRASRRRERPKSGVWTRFLFRRSGPPPSDSTGPPGP